MSEKKPEEEKKAQKIIEASGINKIFDFTLLTQSTDGKETQGKLYNYFYKKFDFRGGRKFN